MSSPSGVRSRAPAASDFSYIQIKFKLIFGHRCISIRCRDGQIETNPGQQAENGTNGRPGRTVIFTGHVIKNPDCLGKSGTAGHLTLAATLVRAEC